LADDAPPDVSEPRSVNVPVNDWASTLDAPIGTRAVLARASTAIVPTRRRSAVIGGWAEQSPGVAPATSLAGRG